MARAFHVSFERQHARWRQHPLSGRTHRVEEIWEYQPGAIHDRADHRRSKLLVLISRWSGWRPVRLSVDRRKNLFKRLRNSPGPVPFLNFHLAGPLVTGKGKGGH